MAPRTSALITGLLLAFTSAGFPADAPQWVQELAKLSPVKYSEHTDAEVLLDDTSITVNSADEYLEHHRRVLRILRRDGRSLASCSASFRGGDKVVSARGWAIDSGGRSHEVGTKQFAERSRFDRNLYDDARILEAAMPVGDPGTVVACEYELREKAWFQSQRWDYQERIPVREARFSIQLPPGWEYKDSWSGSQQVTPAQTGSNSWQWTRRDLAAIDTEERMRPSFYALAERMEVAYFPPASGQANFASWRAIGDWYHGLTTGRRAVTPEIGALVRQLVSGSPDFDSRVRELTVFIQTEVRYFGVEVGIGGWQPHYAADVFRSRYGDCKDKVTLLSAMLAEAGIPSEYLVVHSAHGVVRAELPSLAFNHVILAIELPDEASAAKYPAVVRGENGKHYLLFDPTDEYTPVGRIGSNLQGNYALLSLEKGSHLLQVPSLKPELNRRERTGRFKLAADGKISGDVVDERGGAHAVAARYRFSDGNDRERMQSLERSLGGELGGVALTNFKIENFDQREQGLTFRFSLDVPRYAQISGPLMLVRPRVVGENGFAIDWKTRRYPVELSGTSYQKDVFEIEVPAGYAVDDLPVATQIDVGFANYRSRTEISANIIRYTREYTIRDPHVSSEKFADLRRLIEVMATDEQSRAVLKRAE